MKVAKDVGRKISREEPIKKKPRLRNITNNPPSTLSAAS